MQNVTKPNVRYFELITKAVVMSEPGSLSIQSVDLKIPSKEDIVIDINYSGISTGTEKLFYNGKMPQFPGMGYPLVPGYESTGEVVQALRIQILKSVHGFCTWC